MLFEPACKDALLQLMAVPLILSVISIQFAPSSTDPHKISVGNKVVLRVPVMVCEAVLVLKSDADVPVSLLRCMAVTVTNDAVVSST